MARDFNGSTQSAQIAIDLSAYNQLTVCFWMYIDALATGADFDMFAEFTADGLSTSGGFSFYYYAGDSSLYVNHGGDAGGSQATYSAPSTGAWVHHALTLDLSLSTDEVNYYLNGSLQTPSSRPVNGNNTNNFANDTLYLASRAASDLRADCKIAEFSIHAGILSANSINALAKRQPADEVEPDKIVKYFSMIGRVSPEPDLFGTTGLTLNSSPSQFNHPPIFSDVEFGDELIVPAASSISGESIATLGALTGSAAGTVEAQGASSQTLAALTGSAAGTVDVQGASSQTLAALTGSAAGTVDVQGASSQTLGALTGTAEGTVSGGSAKPAVNFGGAGVRFTNQQPRKAEPPRPKPSLPRLPDFHKSQAINAKLPLPVASIGRPAQTQSQREEAAGPIGAKLPMPIASHAVEHSHNLKHTQTRALSTRFRKMIPTALASAAEHDDDLRELVDLLGETYHDRL